ncbi:MULTISPECIES: MFS transporter [unclassified Streptomyces]|uniref:MFS transporter n=1 Tax=unclassified Streptomyces TaxID=2593676 RepID=UPI0007ED4EB5|nr:MULTISPECIES: MFS transporter [unclassified Streptomyces]MCP3768070.1 MFS transporter [Streptomyces sp. MAR25Y5]OBQ53065.1 MFS transporter [Streptomyces sp. H-KF8]
MDTENETASSDDTTAEHRPVQWGKVIALVGGQGMSLSGSYILLIAMNWTAIGLGGSSAVTTLMLAATVPRALMLVFGGAVSDLFGPRFVLLRTTSARAVVLVAGAAVVATAESLWPLVVIAVLDGVLFGLASPAVGSLVPRLAQRAHLARANSLYAMVLRVAPIVGSPVGAWLIATGELWQALLVTALTTVVWLGCLLYVTRDMARPKNAAAGRGLLKTSGGGLRLLATHGRLRWMFVASLCLEMAFGWPIDVALPLLVDDRGWSVAAVGVIIASFSGGALCASAVGAVLAHRIPVLIRLVVSGAGIAAGIALMALMPSVGSLAVVAAGVGVMSGFNGPAIVTVYQQAAPASHMGAAMSTLSLASIGTAPVSIALFSSLAAGLGLRTTWLLCAVLALAAPAAVLLALRHPESPRNTETGGDGAESARPEDKAPDALRPKAPHPTSAPA